MLDPMAPIVNPGTKFHTPNVQSISSEIQLSLFYFE